MSLCGKGTAMAAVPLAACGFVEFRSATHASPVRVILRADRLMSCKTLAGMNRTPVEDCILPQAREVPAGRSPTAGMGIWWQKW